MFLNKSLEPELEFPSSRYVWTCLLRVFRHRRRKDDFEYVIEKNLTVKSNLYCHRRNVHQLLTLNAYTELHLHGLSHLDGNFRCVLSLIHSPREAVTKEVKSRLQISNDRFREKKSAERASSMNIDQIKLFELH